MSKAKIISVIASDGSTVRFYDEIKAQGGMKDIMFSPDKSYVVAFLREKADITTKERLLEITGRYRKNIFDQLGGEYLKNLYCWPTAVVEHNNKLGVVVPFYRDCFFFEYGSKNDDSMLGIRKKEKVGKWFATPRFKRDMLDQREVGSWQTYLKVCVMLSRAVRRMHMAGLSHSDLGYNNCLIDPTTGQACLIDIDGLVVPGKHPPTVLGTPGFIAPEVIKTNSLAVSDPKKALPSRATDLHALAVMIYTYLFCRHPLQGSKIHDPDDSQRDDELLMGERALFIEHPTDKSNRLKIKNAKAYDLPWKDTDKIPYTISGPYLSALFERAFIQGLHEPSSRPSADEWETALVKTVDLLQPCFNDKCTEKWYPFTNKEKPACPFCGTAHKGTLPVLNLYSRPTKDKFISDNHRIMVYSNQSLFRWHENKFIFPNEKIADADKSRVGYFVEHKGKWYLVNDRMGSMYDIINKKDIPIGDKVELVEGGQILLSREEGGRMISVQLAGDKI